MTSAEPGSSGADGAEPGGAEARDEREMRERLDVEDSVGAPPTPRSYGRGGVTRRQRRAAVQELDERGLLAGDEPVGNDRGLQLDAAVLPALGERLRDAPRARRTSSRR